MAMAKAKQSASGEGLAATEPVEPALGYEEARAALAEVVAALESGDVTLEEALALWEQGEEYARVCEAWLAGAQERLSQDERVSQQESAPLSD
jgi:exodeoxyribonuclease VII small subunit